MHLQQTVHKSNPKFLLALHSCSESFGIGVLDLSNSERSQKCQEFFFGRELSNKVFVTIEKILPTKKWKYISRIVVATGPGSYTGTRVTLTIARTLGQQLGCSVDGINSFKLMAPRLFKELEIKNQNKPFWITSELKRRGIVAGKYLIKRNNMLKIEEVKEITFPKLYSSKTKLYPSIKVSENILQDIGRMLTISNQLEKNNIYSSWQEIFPIYPTSPVSNTLTFIN